MAKLKALVVDDSKVMRLMVMRSLRQSKLAEFQFEEAEDSQDALEKLAADDYKIVFADINMPGMNGIEMLREIRGSDWHPDVTIVMVTSEKTTGKVYQAANAAGADGFISKPFTPKQLESKLGDLIEQLADGDEPAKKSGGLFGRLVKG